MNWDATLLVLALNGLLFFLPWDCIGMSWRQTRLLQTWHLKSALTKQGLGLNSSEY
jgi:hypothetical protein